MIPCVPVELSSTAVPPNDLTAPNEIGFAVVALGTPWIVNDPVAVLPVTLPETPKPPKTRSLGEIFARRPTAFRMIMSWPEPVSTITGTSFPPPTEIRATKNVPFGPLTSVSGIVAWHTRAGKALPSADPQQIDASVAAATTTRFT